MTETDVSRLDFNLDERSLEAIPQWLLTLGTDDTGYSVGPVEAGPLDSIESRWFSQFPRRLLEQGLIGLLRQVSSLRADLETHEERIAMLEDQSRWTDTGVALYRAIPVVQTTRERLWAIGQEGRSRALEYEGDPIEDLHHILPEDLSAEEWQSIMSGAYD
jgi:hypothetical protein